MMQSDKKEDIFDKMMHLPILCLFEPFYLKYKEALLYTFFGGLAFFLNFFLFIGIDYAFQISELVNNIICWIICVLFQFFTNRTWVFDGPGREQQTTAETDCFIFRRKSRNAGGGRNHLSDFYHLASAAQRTGEDFRSNCRHCFKLYHQQNNGI